MLEKTLALILECQKLGRRYVGHRGSQTAPIWFVGEAPGEDEDRTGLPFVGASGRELDYEIKESGIDKAAINFTNPYRLRPPDNDISRIHETGIEKHVFEGAFFEELRHYKPPFIIACGATPLSVLCPASSARTGEAAISKWRGSLLISPFLNWPHYVIPMYHPSFIFREYSERDVNLFILARLVEEWNYFQSNGKHQPLPERNLIVTPSAAEAKDYLNACITHLGPISIDIETVDRKVPITVGLSYHRNHAISIGLYQYDKRDAVSIWRLLDRILSQSRIVGQNYTTFDANWLEVNGFSISLDKCDDTLVRHHVLHPESSHKLDFQVMQYTREPYYKEEGKGWRSKDGISQLMRYNAKDAACTLEVYEEQEKEFDENPSLRRFYNYEMSLARALFRVDKHGILTDKQRLHDLRAFCVSEISVVCLAASKALGNRPIVGSAQDARALAKILSCDEKDIINLSSTIQLKALCNELNIALKKDRTSGKETTGEDSLQEAFAKTGHPVLKHVLRIREVTKLKSTYIDAPLLEDVLYASSAATGTVTGRRASRANFLGYGTNLQNQPKHSDLGSRYLECHIARPGYIFISCDQVSAEEWAVQGIIADVSGDTSGIESLHESIRTGISRHAVLASSIFGLPLEQMLDKNGLEYYLGKKVRHAGNYDMRGKTMSEQMAAEGKALAEDYCNAILAKFHEVEPNIKGVFHDYIQRTLKRFRKLITPLGRERVFHGIHPTRDNSKVFREGYAYIPQSTIGDNTGMALVYVENNRPGWCLGDRHDALVLEVPDIPEVVIEARDILFKAFDRELKFLESGYTVRIPIEFEIGYSIKGLKKVKDESDNGFIKMHLEMKEKRPSAETQGKLAS